jgi:hypothetical protein
MPDQHPIRRTEEHRVAALTPAVDVDALAAHVQQLAANHHVEVDVRPGSGGSARRARRGKPARIRIPEIRGLVSYYVALHELGHLVGRGRSGARLVREAAAWRWALGTAKVSPDRAVYRAIGKRLSGYYQWAWQRGGRPGCPTIPPPDHDFFALLAECGFVAAKGHVAKLPVMAE